MLFSIVDVLKEVSHGISLRDNKNSLSQGRDPGHDHGLILVSVLK